MTLLIQNGHVKRVSMEEVLQSPSDGKFRSINPCPLLCQSAVRKLLLEHAAQTRSHKYTRVSGQTMIELNAILRQACLSRVARLPSKGRTI